MFVNNIFVEFVALEMPPNVGYLYTAARFVERAGRGVAAE